MGDQEGPAADGTAGGDGTRDQGTGGAPSGGATVTLGCRTRGGSSPQGKPRVLFACHPDDFAPYFDDLAGQVLQRSNCAVFYLDPAAAALAPEQAEDLGAQVSQMQLVVVPVTTRLLTRDSLAMSLVIPRATTAHVPVLPIMEEGGLDELFRRRLGDLQYLDPNDGDPTAIPYEEKLTRYLGGVLVGDEAAARVRAAFDAYVFLSYRKRDRAYARELMRLVHRNPLCEGIAIWYDEYLVPGEDFNDAIRAALEKSDLLALVVTPSLLESPNYVMDREWPEARREGKPALPVEMAPTDGDGLRGSYEGIGQPLRPEEGEVTGRLLGMLGGAARAESDQDPDHNFLLGLAYLDGIDVEVDQERAVRLITGAAEAGVEEAVSKLVSMYRDGKGVERDYQASIAWQRRLVDLLRARYGEGPSEQAYQALADALWELGHALEGVAQYGDAAGCYEELRSLSEEGAGQGYADARRGLCVSYVGLGDAQSGLGSPATAAEWYRRALPPLEALERESGTALARRDLCVACDKLGDAEKALGRPGSAREWYLKAVELREAMAEEADGPAARRGLLASYVRLGDAESQLGRPEAARDWYGKSVGVAEGLAEEAGTLEASNDLAVGYERVGLAEVDLGRPEVAEEWYRKAVSLLEALVKEAGTVRARLDLATSYERLGAAELALGRPRAAKGWYERSLAPREALAQETGTPVARRDLSASYVRLGDAESALGRPEAAKGWYGKSAELARALAEETGTAEARRGLSISYLRLGDAESALGNLDAAGGWYGKSMGLAEAVAKEAGTVEARRDLSVTYDRLGAVESALGRPDMAGEWYRKAAPLLETLAKETGTVRARRDLSVTYNKLGDVEKALGGLEAAREWYERSLELREALAQETGTPEARRDLSASCERLGVTEEALGGSEAAGRLYRRSLELREALARETRSTSAYVDLALAYEKMSRVTAGSESVRYLLQAYGIFERLAELCPQVPDYARLREYFRGRLGELGES